MATKATRPTSPPAKPPEEKFWVKYSPHHELPISSLASLAWHTFALVLIVVVAFVVARNRDDDMPIEAVSFNPGGGGNPAGVGSGPGEGATGTPQVEAATATELPQDAIRPADKLTDITGLHITPKDILKDIEQDKDAERELAKITERGTQSLQKLSRLDKRLRDALMGSGKGGPGSGGGLGTGDGTGEGPGSGDGKLNARTKRKLRWTITFNTSSGADYLRQLHVLGAILAFRAPDNEVKVVKDLLARPTKFENDDLKKLNRIFWIDDKRESVEQLSRALGLDFVPDQIVALFPFEFERALLNKELSFRNKREEQILETRFQILMRGTGYTIIVTDQRYY